MQTALKKQPTLELYKSDDRPLNVLILDDLETDRVRLRRFCRKAGLEFQLHQAEDLKGFRAILDEHPIDIAFLDYHLALENGIDALKILTAHEDQVDAIPIMVTSVDRYDVVVDAMRSGCADYLTKEELSVDAIRKSITSAFDRRILIAALNEAQSSRNAMRLSVARIARTCGPEIRSTMAGTIRHVRSLRRQTGVTPTVTENLTKLERSCLDIFSFLDDIKALLDGKPESETEIPLIPVFRKIEVARRETPVPTDGNWPSEGTSTDEHSDDGERIAGTA